MKWWPITSEKTSVLRAATSCWSVPKGLLGTTYMAVIRPFRHLIVHPALTRETERAWQAPDANPDTGADVPQIDP